MMLPTSFSMGLAVTPGRVQSSIDFAFMGAANTNSYTYIYIYDMYMYACVRMYSYKIVNQYKNKQLNK